MSNPSRLSRPNVFEIDLGAIASNVLEIRKTIGPDVRIFVAMKANAYGFGLVEVAGLLQDCGVDTLCVADVLDAYRLRTSGITIPILLYGGSHINAAFVRRVEKLNVWVTVTDVAAANTYSRLARTELGCFVKVDVGLERLGIPALAAADALKEIARLPKLRFEGIYSHLDASATSTDDYIEWQFGRFRAVVREAREAGLTFPIAMAASTPVVPVVGCGGLDAIDVGRLIYGSLRTTRDRTGSMHIRCAFGALRSRLIQVKDIVRHEHLAEAPIPIRPGMRIGIAPIGYADGIESLNCGYALVRGRRVPLVNGSSLEHTRLDLTDVPEACTGDEVVFVGSQGDAEITPDEVLEHLALAQPARMATAVRDSVARVYLRTRM
jgi:alanine racemase